MANKQTVHWSFWCIGIAALLWHVMGAANYLMQMDPGTLENYPESAKHLVDTRPAWATGAFAVAVFIGTAASATMLLKRTISIYLFTIALAGAILTNVHTFQLEVSPDILIGSVLSIVVGALLVWYSAYSKRREWLR